MSTLLSTPLLTSVADGVLTLTLHRPESLNSLNPELLDSLARRLREDAPDPAIRAVLLTGSGRAFCSGQDLRSQLADSAEPAATDVRAHLREHYLPVVAGMRELDKPVIAAINGVAAGAGLSLALAADLRIAAESATLIQAFVRIGLVPDAGGTYALPRLVGLSKALELSMLGDSVAAAEALRIGLVNRVVPDKDLPAAARDLALRLARGPRSLGLIKRLIHRSFDSDFEAQFGAEEEAQLEAISSHDFREGVNAFLEKRAAQFTGR